MGKSKVIRRFFNCVGVGRGEVHASKLYVVQGSTVSILQKGMGNGDILKQIFYFIIKLS